MTQDTILEYTGTASLVILVILFAAIVVYALWPKNKAKFDRASRIPLEKDDDNG